MDSNTIDLSQVEKAISSLVDDKQQDRYQARTINNSNRTRLAYLPTFPTISISPNDYLLLTNVPVTRLTSHELSRRQHGAYTLDALEMMNKYNYCNAFSLSQQDADELASCLQVGKPIITFNADRLRGICHYFLKLHESLLQNVLLDDNGALNEPTLNSKQIAIALEFYLQIHVELFFMKTCSFRRAQPRSNTEGLFCGIDELQATYAFVPCGDVLCSCCLPLHTFEKRQFWRIVNFASKSMHQFINGYTTYLKCPATCSTSNIIYALAWPRGEYGYIDSTEGTLADAMIHHREHADRIIHEKLTGNHLVQETVFDLKQKENEAADKMCLYRHLARCPVALRQFLSSNPSYWCFIPLPWEEALADNIVYLPNASTTNSQLMTMMSNCFKDYQEVAGQLDYMPLPPPAYTFSYRQRQNQRQFFERLSHSTSFLTNNSMPYTPLDLYKVSIIAVLPDDCSIILHYIIETLFVTHAETKLNMMSNWWWW